jgi:hypothetical protein
MILRTVWESEASTAKYHYKENNELNKSYNQNDCRDGTKLDVLPPHMSFDLDSLFTQ